MIMRRWYNVAGGCQTAWCDSLEAVTRFLWDDIGGIVDVKHDWLVVDRMALGRGDGKPSKNVRYRWQVMSDDQSIAYGFRSLSAALAWIVPLMAFGGNASSCGLAESGVDYANFN